MTAKEANQLAIDNKDFYLEKMLDEISIWAKKGLYSWAFQYGEVEPIKDKLIELGYELEFDKEQPFYYTVKWEKA